VAVRGRNRGPLQGNPEFRRRTGGFERILSRQAAGPSMRTVVSWALEASVRFHGFRSPKSNIRRHSGRQGATAGVTWIRGAGGRKRSSGQYHAIHKSRGDRYSF